MVRFELSEPKSLSEACSLLAEYREKAKIIAGGQGLLPLLNHRQIAPNYLVNIKGLPDLEYIVSDGNGHVRIGALTTHRAIEFSPLIKKRYPLLAKMEQVLGCVQTRNWGTIVGNLCAASPTSDPAPVLIALEAIVRVKSVRGERQIPLNEFFTDYLKTALDPDEIVVEIQIPQLPPHTGAAYHKECIRATDSPIASVAVSVTLVEGLGTVGAARIALQAVGPTPLRAREAEEMLIGKKVQHILVDEVAEVAAKKACPISDVYGSAEYKREMVKVAARGALIQAIKRAHVA
ncbi:MAG: xanthine dehydrogenase family protein subunit M [Thermodesulfobacteriota bacterium]|jgi:carbon-monoxide dehydrogenase medium subunit